MGAQFSCRSPNSSHDKNEDHWSFRTFRFILDRSNHWHSRLLHCHCLIINYANDYSKIIHLSTLLTWLVVFSFVYLPVFIHNLRFNQVFCAKKRPFDLCLISSGILPTGRLKTYYLSHRKWNRWTMTYFLKDSFFFTTFHHYFNVK